MSSSNILSGSSDNLQTRGRGKKNRQNNSLRQDFYLGFFFHKQSLFTKKSTLKIKLYLSTCMSRSQVLLHAKQRHPNEYKQSSLYKQKKEMREKRGKNLAKHEKKKNKTLGNLLFKTVAFIIGVPPTRQTPPPTGRLRAGSGWREKRREVQEKTWSRW